MPIGYLTSVLVIGLYTIIILRSPRRPVGLARATFLLTHWVNEYPFIALAALIAVTVPVLAQGDLTSGGGWAVFGVAVVTAGGLVRAIQRAWLAGAVVRRGLRDGLGDGPDGPGGGPRPGDGSAGSPAAGPPPLTGLRALRDIVAPFPVRPRAVQKIANVAYGPAGRRNLMDLYRHRDAPSTPMPVLIHFHGGHFQVGRKSRESLPLLYRLAGEGWLCISANYRLRAAGRFPNSLIDAKAVIAWARTHAAEHGADPSVIVVAGGSAGGHLASMTALTPSDPAFQPPGDDVDTRVAAAVCLYGYYGPRTTGGPPSSPVDYITREAPPFLVAAGDNDNQIDIAGADRFVEALRERSAAPVVYFRLPGAQHGFDLLRSVRYDQVVDGIAAFLEQVRGCDETPAADPAAAQAAGSRD